MLPRHQHSVGPDKYINKYGSYDSYHPDISDFMPSKYIKMNLNSEIKNMNIKG